MKSLLNSASKFMMTDQLGIELYKGPPYKSTVNGQIERFDFTLSEIIRCLKDDGTHRGFEELFFFPFFFLLFPLENIFACG